MARSKTAKSPARDKAGYTIDLQSGELILRGRGIVIRAAAAIAADAWRGVAVAGQRINLALSKDGRSAEIDTRGLPCGAHTLRVHELWSQRSGQRLPDTELDFMVIDSAAPLPPELAVQHAVRLHIGELEVTRCAATGALGAGMVEVFKAEHRKSRKPEQLAFDAQGKVFDMDRALADLAKRRHKVYGKLHPALHAQLQTGDAQRELAVAVWLNAASTGPIDKPAKGARRKRPAAETEARAAAQTMAKRFADSSACQGMKVQRIDAALPVIFGSLSAGRIAALAASDAVSAIFLHEPKGADDLGTSIAIANADDAHTAGFTGRGINVAVYERGPDDNSDLQIAARFTTNPGTSDHSRHTHGIVKNVEPRRPHGHAPDCNLHSANSYDLDAIAWAADQGCTVISQSFHRDSEEGSSGLSFDDIYKDQLALRWPYPTICEAAGNGADTEFVNHKGFNRLTVGNHDDSAGGMASDTVFRNPASGHGDRELPEIAANGTGVTTVGLTKGGTSMAAPAVAGGVALIQQANTSLRSWPEGCRAIMMAAAWRNPAGSTWRADLVAGVDGVDGAGAIDSHAAVQIARARKSRNNAAARRGWDVGTLRSADIGAGGFATFVHRIAVPRLIFSPRIKVALAWDSAITTLNILGLRLPIASTLTVDLDLQVRDANGTVVATSASWDNSYEIAEFAAQAGQTYEIRVRRFSGSDDVWYGVAWQLRGTEFLLERLATVAQLELGRR